MAKTGSQIQGDIFQMLKASALASMLTGNVYRDGNRPRDSRLEDAVVIFTAGLADEVQSGVVTIHIYVPDTDPFSNGVYVADGARCEALEVAASNWVASLKAYVSNYRFNLTQTIATYEEAETKQHFVSVKLGYQLYE